MPICGTGKKSTKVGTPDGSIPHRQCPLPFGAGIGGKKRFMNVACPFCTSVNRALRGDGCCFCDHTGMIPEVEHRRILDDDAENDEEYPFLSDIDLKAGRQILKDRGGQLE